MTPFTEKNSIHEQIVGKVQHVFLVALLIVIAYKIRQVILLFTVLALVETQDRPNITKEPDDALSQMQLYFI